MKKHNYNFYYYKFLKKLRLLKKLKIYNVPYIKGLLFSHYSSLANKNFFFTGINSNKEANIIVSLTSYGERINNVWMTIETILMQTIVPKRIILYLDKSCNNYSELPDSLKKLTKYRCFEIRFCEDLGPHTKYYQAIKDFPDEDVLICDDDVFYPCDWIENTITLKNSYPNCVCCNLAHKIVIDENLSVASYSKWLHMTGEVGPSYLLCALGTGGVLYPKHCLHNDIFDKSFIKDNCLKNDDLWLKINTILSKTKTVKTSCYIYPFLEIKGSSKNALSNINNGLNRNDIILNNILKTYGKRIADIIKDD